MAITRLNSLAIPAGTVEPADISYPLTNFSSTGIDDNATSTAITIDASERIGIGNTSPSYLIDARTASGNAQIYLRSGGDLGQLLLISNDTTGTSQINFGDADANNIGLISYSHNQNALKFTVNAAERMRIDSSGNVGIGGSPVSSTRRLMVEDTGDVRVDIRSGADTNLGAIDFSDTSNTARGKLVYDHNSDAMIFDTLSTERMRIDSSGRLLLGNSSSVSVTNGERQFQIQGTNGVTSSITVRRSQNSSGAPSLSFAKDRGSVSTAVVSGDALGAIYFAGSDGTDLNNDAASIIGWADGTPSSNNTPGRLAFYTNGGSTSSTERMRIDSSGKVGIGTATATYDLTVVGASNFSTIGTNDAALRLRADGARTMQFYTNSAEAMRINSSGYVGIGDSAPPVKLSVETSTSGNWAAVITNTHATNGFGLKVRAGDNSDVDSFRVADVDNAILYQIDGNGCVKVDPLGNTVGLSSLSIANNAMTIGSTTGFNMAFDSNEIQARNNGAANDLVFQKNGGNVGIGTSSPNAQLHVFGGDTQLSQVLNVSDYSHLGQTGSGAMTILGHNARISTSVNNRITTTNSGWHSSFIKMYYNQGISFHVTSSTNTAGDILLDGTGANTHERVRITSNGLTFNGDSAAANALDDYEEGTWTPVLNGNPTHSASNQYYVKIGNLVYAGAYIYSITDYTSAIDLTIAGLPYATNNARGVGSVMFRDVNDSTITQLNSYISTNSSTVYFYASQNAGGSWDPLEYADGDSGLIDIIFNITYLVS